MIAKSPVDDARSEVQSNSAFPDMAGENLVEFVGVAKEFASAGGTVSAVRDVNLTVRPGEFVTIVGPSGCGKSTLLNMTAGLFGPTSGTVLYRGAAVTSLNLRSGYMTQTDHLLPWRTIAQNVAAPLEIRRLGRHEVRERVGSLLALVGLDDFGNSYPSQVSGGMRKRTALARLLAYDPETLLMDEPFGALDAQLRLMLQIQVRSLSRRLGKTVLFITHDVDEAIAIADRCVVFSARPGTVRTIIDVPLSADRDLLRLRFDERYVRICADLWSLLAPDIESLRATT